MIVTVYMILSQLKFPNFYNYWAVMALDIYQLIIWLCAMAIMASNTADVGNIIKSFESAPHLLNDPGTGSTGSSGDGGVNPFGSSGDGGFGSGSDSGSGSGTDSSGNDCFDGICIDPNSGNLLSGRSTPSLAGILGGNYSFGKINSLSDAKTFRGITGALAGINGIQMYVFPLYPRKVSTHVILRVLFGVTLAFVVMAILAHRRAGGHCQPGRMGVARERKGNDVEQQFEPMRHQEISPPQQTQYAPEYPQEYQSQSPPPQQHSPQPQHQPYPSPTPPPQQQYAPAQSPQAYAANEPQYAPVQPPKPY